MNPEPITTEDMRILELNAESLGIAIGTLMENAGREVARIIQNRQKIQGKHIVILCGLGGNGGDGMVAARYLSEAGAQVEVFLIGNEDAITNSDTEANWSILKGLHSIKTEELTTESAIKKCKSISNAAILIDAMLGFGLTSDVREPVATAIKVFNKTQAMKFSIDIPSGIDSDTGAIHGDAIKADVTVTMHAPKTGLLNAGGHTGEVIPVSIGIPSDAYVIIGKGDLLPFTRPRAKHSYKGDYGKVMVIGGSDVYSGAPALSGLAALRTGCDLVSVIVPDPVVGAVRSYSPNLIVQSMKTRVLSSDAIELLMKRAKENDVIAIGPGLGLAEETKSAFIQIIDALIQESKKLVIDADGLKILSGADLSLDPLNTILTPHWGELGILMKRNLGDPTKIENRIKQGIEAAIAYNSTLLVKGATDVIAFPDGTYKLNRTGVAAMTVGGTGDVLVGIVTTLLARNRGAFKASCAAAYISGRAGELAFDVLGNHITATDCIEQIPMAMKLQD